MGQLLIRKLLPSIRLPGQPSATYPETRREVEGTATGSGIRQTWVLILLWLQLAA